MYIVNYSITHREIKHCTYTEVDLLFGQRGSSRCSFFLVVFRISTLYVHCCCYCYNNNYYRCCYCYSTLLYPGDRFIYLFFNTLYEIRSDTKPDGTVYEKRKNTLTDKPTRKSSNLEDALNVSFSIEKDRSLRVHSSNISD